VVCVGKIRPTYPSWQPKTNFALKIKLKTARPLDFRFQSFLLLADDVIE